MSLTPYFGWYYNFHGIFSQFRTQDSSQLRVEDFEEIREYKYAVVVGRDNTDRGRGYKYKPVRYGYGTGTTLKWEYNRDIHVFRLSYTLAFANFQTKDDVWIPSLDDKRHTIRIRYSVTPHEAFNFSLTSSFIIDTPFTPTVITEGGIRKEGELHTGREYFPSMTLIPSVSGNFIDDDVLIFGYRFSLGDILSFAYFKRELKDKETVGASDKDVDNRKYTYSLDAFLSEWIRYFELSIYLTFKL